MRARPLARLAVSALCGAAVVAGLPARAIAQAKGGPVKCHGIEPVRLTEVRVEK